MATTPQPFSFTNLFSDPNFINMLAGIGAEMDPEGAGGILGRAAIGLNKAKAAQKAAQATLHRNPPGMVSDVSADTPLAPTPTTAAPNLERLSYTPVDQKQQMNEIGDLLTPPGSPGFTSATKDKSGALSVKYDPEPKPTVQADIDSTLDPYLRRRDLQQQANFIATSGVVSEPPTAVAGKLDAYSQKHGADPTLARAIVMQESGGSHTNPDGTVKVSSKGARGYMQLMPNTARKHKVNPDDPEQNLEGGVREIAYLKTLSSNPKDILAGYVGGENGMRLYQSQKPRSAAERATLAYINEYVEATYARYQKLLPKPGVAEIPPGTQLAPSVPDLGSTQVPSPGGIAEVPKGTPMSIPNLIYTPAPKSAPESPQQKDIDTTLGTTPSTKRAEQPTTKVAPGTVGADVGYRTERADAAEAEAQASTDTIALDIEKRSPQPAALVDAITHYDLRGLSPAEIDQVVGRALEARAITARANTDKTQLIETDQGYALINKATGNLVPLTSEGKLDSKALAAQGKFKRLSQFSQEMSLSDSRLRPKMNESQAKNLKFGSRALQANERQTRLEALYRNDPENLASVQTSVLATLEALSPDVPMTVVNGIVSAAAAGPDVLKGELDALTAAGLGPAAARVMAALKAREALTPDARELLQNQLEFSTAMLRDESGAAINVGEFLSTYRTYFPQPGDKRRDVLRKMRTRMTAIRGLREAAGRPLVVPDVED